MSLNENQEQDSMDLTTRLAREDARDNRQATRLIREIRSELDQTTEITEEMRAKIILLWQLIG